MSDRARWAVAAAIVAALVAMVRFLAVAGFSNDHYMHFAAAQQVVFGEWPTRDFVDFGMPLMIALSAAVMRVSWSAPLLGETVLVSVMFALSAIVTLYAARKLTGSLLIALLVVALEVAIFPRTYSYPKVLAYAVCFLAMWRYVDRPSTGRLIAIAGSVAMAFLLRYDHGIYAGIGGAMTVLIVSMNTGARESARRVAVYAGSVLALLLPYMVYIMANGGIGWQIRRGIELQAVENARGRRAPAFVFDSVVDLNAVPWLYYLFHLLPVAAMLVVVTRRPIDRREAAIVVPLAVVGILVNLGMMRETLSARIPDAIVPASLLIGWLLVRVSRLQAPRARLVAWGAAAMLLVATAVSVEAVGATREQLDRAEVLHGVSRLHQQFHDRIAQLRERLPLTQMPSRVAFTLLPFFAYADRCLGPRDHVFLLGYFPEAAVWARHPFAGGQIWFQPGVLASDADHRFVMGRLAQQRVPVAVLNPLSDAIAAQSSELAAYMHGRFTEITTLTIDDGRMLRVAFDPTLAVRHDDQTGWPCYQ
jgi:hypothetical protein